jgi:hypothetical protein
MAVIFQTILEIVALVLLMVWFVPVLAGIWSLRLECHVVSSARREYRHD